MKLDSVCLSPYSGLASTVRKVEWREACHSALVDWNPQGAYAAMMMRMKTLGLKIAHSINAGFFFGEGQGVTLRVFSLPPRGSPVEFSHQQIRKILPQQQPAQ